MQAIYTLPNGATERIAQAVAAAEQQTSAEVKVIVLRHCWTDIRDKAKSLFYKHELHKTKDRNAVLILLVLTNREYLVYGDKGIHEKVGEVFWTEVVDAMREKFRDGNLAEGLCAGVARVGEQLATYFPRTSDDVNEISDEVVHED
jgi:uncharacterized membrane protein